MWVWVWDIRAAVGRKEYCALFPRPLFQYRTGQYIQFSAGQTRAGFAARPAVVARSATSRLGRPSQGVIYAPGEETEHGDRCSTRTKVRVKKNSHVCRRCERLERESDELLCSQHRGDCRADAQLAVTTKVLTGARDAKRKERTQDGAGACWFPSSSSLIAPSVRRVELKRWHFYGAM